MATDRYRGSSNAQDVSDQEDGTDREARVAYVLARALDLSDELKTTVSDLAKMLQSVDVEEGTEHSE